MDLIEKKGPVTCILLFLFHFEKSVVQNFGACILTFGINCVDILCTYQGLQDSSFPLYSLFMLSILNYFA